MKHWKAAKSIFHLFLLWDLKSIWTLFVTTIFRQWKFSFLWMGSPLPLILNFTNILINFGLRFSIILLIWLIVLWKFSYKSMKLWLIICKTKIAVENLLQRGFSSESGFCQNPQVIQFESKSCISTGFYSQNYFICSCLASRQSTTESAQSESRLRDTSGGFTCAAWWNIVD